ncbi:hypothetical protein ACFL0M_00120 [Thermodesulfobacteriota bacterium]
MLLGFDMDIGKPKGLTMRKILKTDFAVVDLETTGLFPGGGDRIIFGLWFLHRS